LILSKEPAQDGRTDGRTEEQTDGRAERVMRHIRTAAY